MNQKVREGITQIQGATTTDTRTTNYVTHHQSQCLGNSIIDIDLPQAVHRRGLDQPSVKPKVGH